MKKIAICLPSFNECKNIQFVTKVINEGLKKYNKNFECYIVNADNNSPDNTNKLFNQVETCCEKVSLISYLEGKGENLINFFNFCKNYQIDYAITIDSDVVSIEIEWIDKFLKELIDNNFDYVTPIYQRSRYEGSTTNHFTFPAVYALCHSFIRQPISGNFGFSRRFINLITRQKINSEIKKYGIDIYMTLTACFGNLKIKQIMLGSKLHNSSFYKIKDMFKQVLQSFIKTVKCKLYKLDQYKNQEKIYLKTCSLLPNRDFKHKEFAKKEYKKAKAYFNKQGIKITHKNIEDLWIKNFALLIKKIKQNLLDEKFLEDFEQLFYARSTSFWLQAEKISAQKAEEIIICQAIKIFKEVNYENNN